MSLTEKLKAFLHTQPTASDTKLREAFVRLPGFHVDKAVAYNTLPELWEKAIDGLDAIDVTLVSPTVLQSINENGNYENAYLVLVSSPTFEPLDPNGGPIPVLIPTIKEN